MTIHNRFYPETEAGGFTRFDGTIQFYTRINALLEPNMTILDLGAGRGLTPEGGTQFSRKLVQLRGKVSRIIGVDIDPAVKSNPFLDEAIVYDGKSIDVPDQSIDLLISEATFEHITDPAPIAREISRIVKPGGWVCARTPHLYSALVLGASLIPNSLHHKVLRRVQPGGRAERDVFPTVYKMNSSRTIKRLFPREEWDNFSYTWSPEPGYHFGSPAIYALFQMYQYLKKPLMGGEFLLVFLRKRAAI